MRAFRLGMPAFGLVLAGLLAPVVAQEPAPSKDVRQIQREQEAAIQALDRLDVRMQKIADDLKEKQPEDAARLRAAWEELKKRFVKDDMQAVVDALKKGQAFDAVPKEDEILEDLREILRILTNEKKHDPAKLAAELKRVQEAGAAVKEIKDKEQKNLEQTQARNAAKQDLKSLDEASKALAKLAAEQKAMAENPQQGAQESAQQEAQNAQELADAVSALQQAQQKLQKAMESAVAKDVASAVEQAKDAAEKGDAGEAQKKLDDAMKSMPEDLKTSAQQAAKDLAKAASAAPEGAPEATTRTAKAEEAQKALKQATDQLTALAREAKKAQAGERENLAGEQKAVAEQAQNLAGALERMAKAEQNAETPSGQAKASEAKQALEKAAQKGESASKEAQDGQLSKAAEQAKEAEKALDEAKKALDGKQDLLKKRQAAEQTPERQGDLAARTEETSEAIEKLQAKMQPRDKDGAEKASEAAQKTKAASEQMSNAAKEMQKGGEQSAAAKEAQKKAEDALKEAQKALEEARKRVLERLEKAELKERAAKEKKQAEEAKKLSEDLRQGERTEAEKAAGESMSGASGSMGKAGQKMEEGEEEQAEKEQEKAVEELKKAEEQLAEQEEQYRDLEQEQELLSMRAELEKAINEQTEINKETVRLDDARKNDTKIGRKERIEISSLADREGKLSEQVQALVKKLGEEQQVWVFARRLEDARIDMDEIVRLMGNDPPEIGEHAQRLETDVLRTFLAMKEAFERQLKEPKEGGGGGGGGPQKKRLVPPLAELKMLKSMQEQILRETERLNEAIDRVGGTPNEMQKELLKRTAARQGNLADLLDQMNKDLTGSEGEADKTPGAKNEEKKQ